MINEREIELINAIKDLEHKAKYTKNPLEERNLRSKIGQYQKELSLIKNKKH